MRTKSKKIRKTQIICFRISEGLNEQLHAIHSRHSINGVKSPQSLCRKWISDVVNGRLVYKNPEQANYDVDLAASKSAQNA
jgi:hypothetical protein